MNISFFKKPINISELKIPFLKKKGEVTIEATSSESSVAIEVEEILSSEHPFHHKPAQETDELGILSETELQMAESLDLDALKESGYQEEFEAQFGSEVIKHAEKLRESPQNFVNNTDVEDELEISDFEVFDESLQEQSLEKDLESIEEDEGEVQFTDHSSNEFTTIASVFRDEDVKINRVSDQHHSTFSILHVDYAIYRALLPTFDDYNNRKESDFEDTDEGISSKGSSRAKDLNSGYGSGTNLVAIPMHSGEIVLFPRSKAKMQTRFVDEVRKLVAIAGDIDINKIQTRLIDDTLFSVHAKEVHTENIRRKNTDVDSSSVEDEAATKELLVSTVSLAVQNNCTDIHMYLRENFEIQFRANKLIQSHLTINEEHIIGRSLFNTIINDLGAQRCSGTMNYVDFEGTSFALQVYKDKQRTSPITVELRIEKAPIDGGSREESAGMYIRISKNDVPQTLEQLKIAPPMIKMFRRAMHLPKGMIIVTGPTGSGKTTLLHAILREMLPGLSARTIEDPVELRATYNSSISQMSIPKHKWQEALESVLRQDPDVVMIGEIRSGQMLRTLLEAVDTGHLTLSTLHTNSAISTLMRMINIGGKPEDLAADEVLTLIIATRLNNLPCKLCARKFNHLSDEEKKTVYDYLGEADMDKVDSLIFTNEHSENCTCNRGKRGMSSMQEVIKINDSIRKFIAVKDWDGMKDYLVGHGWKDFETQAREKILEGELDLFEVQRVVKIALDDEENFQYNY